MVMYILLTDTVVSYNVYCMTVMCLIEMSLYTSLLFKRLKTLLNGSVYR